MYDREQKGLKKKRGSHLGMRKSMAHPSKSESSATRRPTIMSNTMRNSPATTSNNFSVMERMRDAVALYLSEKKTKDKNVSSPLKGRQSTPGHLSPQSGKPNDKSKPMGKIMELIYANSLYASIH